MELYKESWYVRWFFWSLAIWGSFLDDPYADWYHEASVRRNGTNLCFFMRVILVYAPLVLLLQAIMWSAVVACVTVMPISLFGWTVYAWIMGAVAVVVALILLYGRYSKISAQRERESSEESSIASQGVAKEPARIQTPPPPPGFLKVVGVYAGGVKSKICPRITFASPEENGL